MPRRVASVRIIRLLVAAALIAGATACDGARSPAPATGPPAPTNIGTDPGPVTHVDRQAAAGVARSYVDLLAQRNLAEAHALTVTGGARAQRSLLDLETWLTRLKSEDVQVTARNGAGTAYPVRARVTLRARFGPAPGSAWVLVGRWTFALVRQANSWRVIAELERNRVARGGLVNLRIPLVTTGMRGAVITGSPDDKRQARAILRVLDSAAPSLGRSFGHSRSVDHPIVLLASTQPAARLLCDCWFPEHAVAVSANGIIVVSLASWSAYGAVMRNAIIVHELTHAAMTGVLPGSRRLPWSLLEGAASYEEYRYAARRGVIEPLGELAAAYRRGYPTELRWRSTRPQWGLTRSSAIQLAYGDALAVVYTTVTRHGGIPSVLRLAHSFQLQSPRHGTFTEAQLENAFETALGTSFAQIADEAHAWVLARG